MTEQQTLKRSLKLPQLVLFGITYMTVITVFTTYGFANALSDNKLPLAYIVATFAMFFTALSYAAMARRFPVAGSAYTYSQQAFGGEVGFLTGWATLLDYLFIPLINFMLFGIYLNQVLPAIPFWVFSLIAIAAVYILNIMGVTMVSRINTVVITLGMIFVAVFVVLSIGTWMRLNDQPTIFEPFTLGDTGLTGVLAAAAMLALSFLGFDAVSTLAEEAKNARRDIPRAIVLTALIGGLLFTIVSWAGTLALQPDWASMSDAELDTASAYVTSQIGGEILMNFFIAVYVAGCIGSGMTGQVGVSRILFSMGRDGLLPKPLANVWKKRGTPVIATTVVTLITLGCMFLPLAEIINVVSFGALAAFTMVNLATIRIFAFGANKQVKDLQSALRYIIAPLIGAALTLWLWTSLSGTTFVVGLCWLALGALLLAFVTKGFTRRAPKLDFAAADINEQGAPTTNYIDSVGTDYPFRDAR